MGLKDVLFGKQRQVEQLYGAYLDQWKKCTNSFGKAIDVYLSEGPSEQFSFWCADTHKQESHADDLRRGIEYELYSKALLPESRGDILGLLETVDKVINKVESVLFQIDLESIELPDEIQEYVERITVITRECLELIHEAAAKCFHGQEEILDLAERIDQKESECDHSERTALKTLFDSELPWHVKFQLKNLIIELGNITDRAEAVSDRLVIMSVKRKV